MVLLLLTSPPRTLRAVGGGSAAGPSHSRHFAAAQQFGRIWNEADINHKADVLGGRGSLRRHPDSHAIGEAINRVADAVITAEYYRRHEDGVSRDAEVPHRRAHRRLWRGLEPIQNASALQLRRHRPQELPAGRLAAVAAPLAIGQDTIHPWEPPKG